MMDPPSPSARIIRPLSLQYDFHSAQYSRHKLLNEFQSHLQKIRQIKSQIQFNSANSNLLSSHTQNLQKNQSLSGLAKKFQNRVKKAKKSSVFQVDAHSRHLKKSFNYTPKTIHSVSDIQTMCIPCKTREFTVWCPLPNISLQLGKFGNQTLLRDDLHHIVLYQRYLLSTSSLVTECVIEYPFVIVEYNSIYTCIKYSFYPIPRHFNDHFDPLNAPLPTISTINSKTQSCLEKVSYLGSFDEKLWVYHQDSDCILGLLPFLNRPCRHVVGYSHVVQPNKIIAWFWENRYHLPVTSNIYLWYHFRVFYLVEK